MDFVRKTGGIAAFGSLGDALPKLQGKAGTTLTANVDGIEWDEQSA